MATPGGPQRRIHGITIRSHIGATAGRKRPREITGYVPNPREIESNVKRRVFREEREEREQYDKELPTTAKEE